MCSGASDGSGFMDRVYPCWEDSCRSANWSIDIDSVDDHIEGPAIATADALSCHDGHRRREARTVGHDRVVLAEFATGIDADGFQATHGLFGQRQSQPGLIERLSDGYEPGRSTERVQGVFV